MGIRDADAWEEFLGIPSQPSDGGLVWFSVPTQTESSSSEPPVGHSLRMPSKGKCSCVSMGVEMGNKFQVLVLEGANAVFRRGVGRESRRRPQPLVSFSELGLPALCWVSQGLVGTVGTSGGPGPCSAQAAAARTLLKCLCHVGGDRARPDPDQVLYQCVVVKHKPTLLKSKYPFLSPGPVSLSFQLFLLRLLDPPSVPTPLLFLFLPSVIRK